MDASTIPEPPPAPPSDPGVGKPAHAFTTPIDVDSSSRSNGRASIESSMERPKSQAGEAADSAKAGPSGFSKLLKGRRRKKKNQTQMEEFMLSSSIGSENDRDQRGSRSNESRDNSITSSNNENPSPPENEPINLLTDDSEPDKTPPLISHNSHAGFHTTSSPLINTTSTDAKETDDAQADVESAVSGPSVDATESNPDSDISRPPTQSGANLDVPEGSKKRGKSPGRRLKNAFSSNSDKKNSNNAKDARDRASSTSGDSRKSVNLFGNSSRRGSLSAKRAQTVAAEPPPPLPLPIRTDLTEDKPSEPSEMAAPRTPPHTAIPAPQTTVTPPTPKDHRTEFSKLVSSPDAMSSPESVKSRDSFPPGVVVSPSGNMISHRRVRSASSATHKPSKLSNSISAVSPTIEEVKSGRTPSGAQQTGFFSSVFSVAQNAANTLINPQQKGRSGSQYMAGEGDAFIPDTKTDENKPVDDQEKPEEKKPLAIETLGSGDLNFGHLEIDVPPGGTVATPDGVVITKPDVPPEKRKNATVYQRDEEAAKLEDKRAARAVYMAYGKPSEVSVVPPTPTEEGFEMQSSTSLPLNTRDQTPPGSMLEGEPGSGLQRSGSVRSRLARRHRGSSATTSTVGPGGISLGVPGANSSMPRLTGFAVASKKRNRDFHQLFRSVPEDDYLIEDYSCALQREIILAGRIYISEGHICFSSNILGWVTTLVISFDEVVAIEKESTAMVFPNAIAIQTLHARHTFRSLLSRESTYDLMVNIWKINHPGVKSSVNGTRISHGTGDKTEKAGASDVESDGDESDEDEIYDEDEDGDGADSIFEAGGTSMNASNNSLPPKGLSRQASGNLPTLGGAAAAATPNANGEVKGDKAAGGGADDDFPGPSTHAPSEYTDPAGQYDKVIKDETIPAPLGKVYSLVFGPASGAFITKFLVDNQKSGELQFESEKKGLTNESRTRQYSYIKPLNGSIGPKQTKCISTEYLDFLDLDKAVLVTLSTQTPDVPSGNVFCTKTKYLFTWAPGNQTRFFMSCTIEWSGKSWLKGPIEKGAIDGQTAFGNDLVAALKAAVVPRSRSNTKTGGKGKGKRKKGSATNLDEPVASAKTTTDAGAGSMGPFGFLEPLTGLLGPITGILKPLLSGNFALLIIGLLIYMVFFRGPSNPMLSHDIGCPGYTLPQRLAAYEEMWRREESELWSWLEDRVGLDGMVFPTTNRPLESQVRQKPRKLEGERELAEKISEEKMSDREMDHAIRTTRERLDVLEEMLSRRKAQTPVAQSPVVESPVVNDEKIHQEL